MRTALLVGVLLCISTVFAQSLIDFELVSPYGTAGNGTIWYQQSNFFTIGNVQNPVTVEIIYASGQVNAEAQVCLNYNAANAPVSGVNLEITCPAGAYGTAANATDGTFTGTTTTTKLGQLSNRKSQFIGARMALSDDSDFTEDSTFGTAVYLRPTNGAGFVVTLPDVEAKNQKFQVWISGKACNSSTTYPVGSSGSCVEIDDITTLGGEGDIPVAAGQWVYYKYAIPYSTTVSNSFAVTINGTDDGAALYIQSGYYPTDGWYLNAETDEGDGTITYTILNPGNGAGSETFFFGLTNSGDDPITVHLNYTLAGCGATSTKFGYECSHDTANTTDPSGGYFPISATLVNEPVNLTNSSASNGTARSYDYSDDDYENDYAYFSLIDLPTNLATVPYYVRVSVAANDNGEAPGLFAKQGGFPSAQSNTYNVSTSGDVTHQIAIMIDQATLDNYKTNGAYVWYVAVQLPSDFSFWVGSNCAGNCSEGEHGTCYCNNPAGGPAISCEEATSNFENPEVYYELPNSLEDSGGACTCDDDSYDESFDCSTKNNPYLWLWILLIVIAVIVVLVIAVAVPAFFIYQQRQKKRSGYDVVDDGRYD